MKKTTLIIVISVVGILILASFLYIIYSPGDIELENQNPMAKVYTNVGNFTIELYEDKVPNLVKHFLYYVGSNFYDDVIFHMVEHPHHMDASGHWVPLKGSMIVTGLFDRTLIKKKPEYVLDWGGSTASKDIGLTHEDLMVSWLRNNSASLDIYSQFYICNGDDLTGTGARSARLDAHDPVFGKVIKGAEVIRNIANMKTYDLNKVYNLSEPDGNLTEVPMENNKTIVIEDIKVSRPNSEEKITVYDYVSNCMDTDYIQPFFLKYSSMTTDMISIPAKVAGYPQYQLSSGIL